MRALDLRWISDHKFRFFVEERFECFPRIVVLQKALDAFVTGASLPAILAAISLSRGERASMIPSIISLA
jgi:hypothetical protein